MVTWRQLRKRKLVQWAAAYAAAAWVTLQLLSLVGQQFDWSPLLMRLITVALAIGFVVTVVLAWYHGERGEQKVTGSEVAILIVTLTLGGGVMWRVAHGQHATADAASAQAAATVQPAIPDIAADPSIAVMPFLDMSQAHDQEYLSDGISEELLNLLARIPKLRTIARTSCFAYKNKQATVAEIAKALHVSAILEGSVRRDGDTVRVSVQLIRASDSSELWSETYDRPMDDIFKVQDDIAAAVAAKLRITLLDGPPTVRKVDPRIYPMILQAKALGDQNTPEAYKQALALYQQAAAIAPDEPRVWIGIARIDAYSDAKKTREELNKALALDPGNAHANSLLALDAEESGNYAAAVVYHKRALELGPTNLSVLGNAANTLQHFHFYDLSLAIDRYRMSHDPANPIPFTHTGLTEYLAGHWDEAIDATRKGLSISPKFSGAHLTIAQALLKKGDAKAALAEVQAEPTEYFRMCGLPMALHSAGRKAEAKAALDALIAKYGQWGQDYIALNYAWMGDADQAFAWLDKLAANKDVHPTFMQWDPMFDKLHDDPRWMAFLKKIGKTPEELQKLWFPVNVPN